MRRLGARLLLAVGLSASGPAGALAQAAPEPLAITVHPQSFAPGPETLEQKLARRTRESEFMFRHICRDCDNRIGGAGTTFEPQAILDDSRRAR